MAQRSFRFSSTGWILAGVSIFGLLLAVGFLPPVQKLAVRVLSPLGRIAHTIVEGARLTITDRQQTVDVEAENTALRERVVQLELERASLNQQIRELNILRDEQAFLDRRSLQGIAVRVIGRSQLNTQRVLVDGGQDLRIQRGAPVLAGDGVLVGLVEDVLAGSSSVRLLTADSTNVAVRVRDQSGPPGIVVGERGVGMRLTLVPQNEKLEKGQAIITADADPQIPSGILVGTISTVDIAPGALFQSASILPVLPLDRLNVLTVLTSS